MIKTATATPRLQISGVETAAKTLAAKTLVPKTSPSRTAVSGAQCFPFPNDDIADTLEQVADLLEIKEENYYRVRAYREAGQTIRGWDQPIVEILRTAGTRGLEKLPHVGQRVVRGYD